MCACICVCISSRFIPFKALYCLSLGFPKSRCVGAVFDSRLHAQITVRTHPLDYKRAKLTGKKRRIWESEQKRVTARMQKLRTCQKMWEKGDWCSCFGGGMQRRNIILQLSALTTTTHVFALWKKVLLYFLLGVWERETEIRKCKCEMCEYDETETMHWAKFKEEHGASLFSLWKKNTHKLHSMNIWLNSSHWEDE